MRQHQEPARLPAHPETQKAWAEANFQRTKMVTSFADGTKIAMEMCTVANATGMGVGKRGMYGPTAGHVDEAPVCLTLMS